MSILEFNRSIAVIVGINEYRNGIPRLKTAVNDAQTLADMLREKYKYEVLLLLDKEGHARSLGRVIDSIRAVQNTLDLEKKR